MTARSLLRPLVDLVSSDFQVSQLDIRLMSVADQRFARLYGQVDNFRMRHSGVNVLSDRVPSVPGLNARDSHCYPEWDSKSRQIRSCRANRNSLSTLLL